MSDFDVYRYLETVKFVTPRRFKQYAKQIKKIEDILHHEANDKAARLLGYDNLEDLKAHITQPDCYYRKVTAKALLEAKAHTELEHGGT